MEKILPKMSVDKKIKRQMSVLVGNYEFYYALGAFEAAFKVGLDKEKEPGELKKEVENYIKDMNLSIYEPNEEAAGNHEDSESRRNFLTYLLNRYEADEKYDDAMKELFDMGYESWKDKL
jgi:hypothetical protein